MVHDAIHVIGIRLIPAFRLIIDAASISHTAPVMSDQRVPLSILIESGFRMSWQQAVALVQGIVAVAGQRRRPMGGGDPLAELALDADGVVVVIGDDDPALSVSELALLLGRLLPGEAVAARDRAPAGVQFAVSRALGLAPAPSFSSVEEFSRVLARFEAADRRQLLRAVFDRYLVHNATHAEEPDASASWQSAAGRQAGSREHLALLEHRLRVERRRSRITPDVARRLLRDADERHFHARMEGSRAREQSTGSVRQRSGVSTAHERGQGVPVDMLRRFLREADRRAFETGSGPAHARRSARGIGSPTRSRWQPRSRSLAVLAAALLAAGGTIAELYRFAPASAPADASRPIRDTRTLTAGRTVTVAAPAAGNELAVAAAVEGRGVPPGERRAGPGNENRGEPVAGTPMRRGSRQSAKAGGRTPLSPGAAARRSSSTGSAVVKPARPAVAPAQSVDAGQPRRSAPVRFFSAVRRGFLRLVHGPQARARKDGSPMPAVQ